MPTTETLSPTESLPERGTRNEPREVNRRSFLAGSGAGLLVGFFLPSASRQGQATAAAASTQVNSWLNIGSDGTITFTIGISEMGQGSYSGLAQILAEELIVKYSAIATVQGAPTFASPAPLGTAVVTAGSSAIRTSFWALRTAAATAREMLVSAAMKATGDTNRSHYTIAAGVITYSVGKKTFTYGQLAAAAALVPPPVNPPLLPESQFQVIGTSVPRLDIPLKVDGSAKYGIDIRLPNMLYAVIKHSPAFGGTLASTPRVPEGAIAVIPTKVVAGVNRGLDAIGNVNAVAVVATNTWDAWQGADEVHATWNPPPNAANLNNAQFLAEAQALVTSATPYLPAGPNAAGTLYTVEGSASATASAIGKAVKIVDVQYTLPYVSHACLEVLNCTVDYQPGVNCTIYAPTQAAVLVLAVAMELTGLPASKITVHTTYLGGGLGRKLETDFVSQAIQVSMAVGKPVKVMWPREQDFTHDQYRPMALIHARAGLDSSKKVVGWSYRNISPSILAQRGVPLGPQGDSQGYEASDSLPYNFGSRVTEYVTHPSPIPVGFWRSVGASINTFAVESMMDELAAAAGEDPYEFRRNLLTDSRWVAVLDAAAVLGDWGTAPAKGHFRGIAIGTLFGSIVAEVVEISSVTATSLRVSRVSIAMDCYLAVNPGAVEAQLIGGVVHGMNAALYGRQNFVNGAAQFQNFSNSRMIRLGEMPQVDIALIPNPTILDSTTPIGGAGELGVPTFAPALANAYFKATGTRVRALPFYPNARMDDI